MAPPNTLRPTIEEKLLSQAIAQVDKTSSTLSQIARHLKADQPGGRIEGDIDDALCDLLDCRTMLLQALRRARNRQIRDE